MVSDADSGRTDRAAKLEWPLLNTSIGGNSRRSSRTWLTITPRTTRFRCSSHCPLATQPATFHPILVPACQGTPSAATISTSWYAAVGMPMVRSRQAGKAIAAILSFPTTCQNSRIDHEHETCGSFDIVSHGKYIYQQRTVFNNYNMMLATAEFSNLAGYLANPAQTACTEKGSCFEWQAVRDTMPTAEANCFMASSRTIYPLPRGAAWVYRRHRGYDWPIQWEFAAGLGKHQWSNRRLPLAGLFARRLSR